MYKSGAILEIYDPKVSKKSILNDIDFYWEASKSKDLKSRILIIDSLSKLDLSSNATAILTEWEEFSWLDFSNTIVFDGRGVAQTTFYSIGKG